MFIKKLKEAPGQNRTDASSLEGYSSTTELQAREINDYVNLLLFLQEKILLETFFFTNPS